MEALRFHKIQNLDSRGSRMKKFLLALFALLFLACAWAQDTSKSQDSAAIEPMDQTPVFRVKVVSRTTKAVNYRHRGGSTTVDLKGTSLMPEATGHAKVDGK